MKDFINADGLCDFMVCTYAQVGGNLGGSMNTEGGPKELIVKLLAYALIVAAILSVVYVIIGGISFILSGGDEGKIKSAVNTIRYAVIGFVITLLSFAMVYIVGGAFADIDMSKVISYDAVISKVKNIVGQGDSGGGSGDPFGN